MYTPVDDVHHLAPVVPSSEKMMLKGQKRKVPPAEEEQEEAAAADAGSEAQRLLVLHVSLHKYQHGQELAEPSLRRSVLIANTLRRMTCLEAGGGSSSSSSSSSSNNGEVAVVEDRDGVSSPLPPAPCEAADSAPQSREIGTGLDVTISATTSASTTSNHQLTSTVHSSHSSAVSDVVSPSQSHQNAVASSRPHHQVNLHAVATASTPDVCIETAGDSEDWESLSAAISSILTSLESSIDGGVGNQGLPAVTAVVAPRTPLRSLENLGAAEGEGGASKLGQQQQGVKAPCWERAASADPSCVEVMRSSYLGDFALDDLFQDIDTSLLERELGVLGSRGEGGHPPTGEELLRYLPSLSSSSSSAAAPSSLSFLSSSSPFLSFNQSLWCLPSISSFHPSTSPISTSSFFSFPSPSASSPSSTFPGQPLVRDGLELDHQMEVLVES